MDLTPDPTLPVSKVGRYELLRRIAVGGMAEVFLARRVGIEGFSHLCVVKTILPRFADDPEFVQMFVDEARITVELQHPNVVRVFDLDRDGDFLYLAMEYVDGMDVLTMLVECEERGIAVPFATIVYVIYETLKGLHYAHSAKDRDGQPLGLVHRDISPGNILLGRNGTVKLSDFGLARASISRRPEEPGNIVGTQRYVAPEILLGGANSHASDLFSVGVCFYELVANNPLFPPAENAIQQQLYLRDWSPEKMLEGHQALPDGVADILLKALAKEPDGRFSSALEFQSMVADLASYSRVGLDDKALIHFLRDLSRVRSDRPFIAQPLASRFRDESGRAKGASVVSTVGSWLASGVVPHTQAPVPGHASSESPVVSEAGLPGEDPISDPGAAGSPGAAPAPPEAARPWLADLLSDSTHMPLDGQEGAQSPLRLLPDTSVELFTSRGRHGPFSGGMLMAMAVHARPSGVELVSVNGDPWEPLLRHSIQAGPEFEKRVHTVATLALPQLLLAVNHQSDAFELMLWSDAGATFLAVVDGRVVDVNMDPPARMEDEVVLETMAQSLRWPAAQALVIRAPWRLADSGAPRLENVLLSAMDIALPPQLLRRIDELRGPFAFRRKPTAMDPTEHLSRNQARLYNRFGRGPMEVSALSQDHELRAALRLVAQGLAEAFASDDTNLGSIG